MLDILLSENSKRIISFGSIGNRKTILGRIKELRTEIIDGLRSVEQEDGWLDPTEESAQALWTCVEVCKSLVEASEPIRNLDAVLVLLDRETLRLDGLIGWESESLPGLISTYATSDAGLLFQAIGKEDELVQVLCTLKKIQNPDGGWGVCNIDNVSKTRATSFVLRLYAKCIESPWAFRLVDRGSYLLAIEWLIKAQNDADGGWANLADTYPSEVSATAIVLNSLLSAKLAAQKHPEMTLPLRDSIMKLGITRLLQFNSNGKWRGAAEEFGIRLPNQHGSYRHTASGMGTLVVLQVLCKAARLGFISPDDKSISLALEDIINRCALYPPHKGKWIVPSDQNGIPTSWNSAFALDGFLEFQRLYLDCLYRGITDTTLTAHLVNSERLWRKISIILLIIVIGMLLVPRLTFLQEYNIWFNSQSSLMQGLIMAVIGVIVERLLSLIGVGVRTQISGMLNHLKNRDADNA